MIEIIPHITNGHRTDDFIRMPTLMPEMYALARCGHLPQKNRPTTSLRDYRDGHRHEGRRVIEYPASAQRHEPRRRGVVLQNAE